MRVHGNCRYPRLRDREWLRQEYVENGRTASDIAAEVGCSGSAVQLAMKGHGLPMRPRHGAPSAVNPGDRFERLLVVAPAGYTTYGRNMRQSLCRCDCGTEKVIANHSLRCGAVRSCGCLSREYSQKPKKHGHTKGGMSPTYMSYANAKSRVTYPSCPSYERYGGRGITMCQRWRDSFEAFLADMGERPEAKSLDRIDPDGNYEPANCRWATSAEQNANRLCRDLDPAEAVTRAMSVLREYAPHLLAP